MKKYVKPQMIIEEFRADESICTCTDEYTMLRGYPFNEWYHWTDENGDRAVQRQEIGTTFNPEGRVGESFVVYVGPIGPFDLAHGTIVSTRTRGLVYVTYRNAS